MTDTTYNGPERRMADDEPKQRSLWREIVGTMIGSIPLALTVLAWGVSIETRFTRHDGKIEVLEKANDAQDIRVKDMETAITRKLERMDGKLDRIIEKQIPPPVAVGPGVWRERQRPANPTRPGDWRDGREVNR
jgi:hypothetical protein